MSLVFEIVSDEKQMITVPLGNRMKSENVLVDTFLMICYTSNEILQRKTCQQKEGDIS